MTTYTLDPALERLADLHRSMRPTPTTHLDHDTVDLYAKLEYHNPSGSAKDRSAYWILRKAVERGDIGSGGTVVESSSGNFAVALASFCRQLRIAFVPVLDPNVNQVTERQLRVLCDRVEKVTQPDASGGYLGARLARVEELCRTLPGAYWPNQYANVDAVEAHEELTGAELCQALPRLDVLFVGVSTGGTIAGLSRRVKRVYPSVRVVAVDAEGSAIFGGPPAPRRIPGLGSTIVPPLVRMARIDEVRIVSELDAVRGCHDLLVRHGVFVGGSSGSVYAAIEDYFAGYRGPRPTVAFLCADRGTAYADTIFNPEWVGRTLGADPGRVSVSTGPVSTVAAR